MQFDGYYDFQVNGYVGVDFNDPLATPEALNHAAEAMLADGVHAAFPTVITAGEEAMLRCIEVIRVAVSNFEAAARVFRGIHLEGPFISAEPGFVGAHPGRFAGQADPKLLERLIEKGGSLVRLVTLAPEVDQRGELTELCVGRDIVVAAGHTDASVRDLERCIDRGLSLFTHLGNGCPRLMDRHDNIILRALTLRTSLRFSLIADGHHVPEMLFRFLLDIVPFEHLAVVSDAISAAGLGPGNYQLGERSVTVGSDLAARDVSGEHFVGAASRMVEAEGWLRKTLGLTESACQALLAGHAQRWFGKP